MSKKLLLYGSYGYTGSLIARLASDRGLRPILAGRDRGKLSAQAATFGWEYRAFSLEDAAAARAALSDIAVVLNCAGPFSRTLAPMVAACLLSQTHYLDITGEIAAFQAAADRDADAKAAGIMLLPGAGFDIVPSDCLAARLKARLPDATRLALGFQALSRMSRGTATTMVEAQKMSGLVRRGGILAPVPFGWKTRAIDFGRGRVNAVTIPWGDVFTAYYSTQIPDIEVYAAFPESTQRAIAIARHLGWLLRSPLVQDLQKRLIQLQPPGPTDEERARGLSLFWGEAENNSGKKVVSRLQCPEGYTLTALTALAIAQKVLDGLFRVGFQTPSQLYGADFILEIDGVARQEEPPAQVMSS